MLDSSTIWCLITVLAMTVGSAALGEQGAKRPEQAARLVLSESADNMSPQQWLSTTLRCLLECNTNCSCKQVAACCMLRRCLLLAGDMSLSMWSSSRSPQASHASAGPSSVYNLWRLRVHPLQEQQIEFCLQVHIDVHLYLKPTHCWCKIDTHLEFSQ